MFLEPIGNGTPEILIAQFLPPHGDDLESIGKPTRSQEFSESRQQIAPDQIAGGAEQQEPVDHGLFRDTLSMTISGWEWAWQDDVWQEELQAIGRVRVRQKD